MTTRRKFLKTSLAGSAMISLSGAVPPMWLRASAATANRRGDSILVVVQLDGGNDGLNTIIPYADDEYYKNRFTLAIPRDQVTPIDDHIGFHPSLGGMAELLDENWLNVIQGVGYPNPNRSHFESMDLWQTAHRKSASIPQGWLGRYLHASSERDEGNLPAIHLGGEEQPLALADESQVVPSIRSLDSFRLHALANSSVTERLESLVEPKRSSDHSLLGFIHENANLALATSHTLESVTGANGAAASYPNSGLANKLRTIASLIEAGLGTRIYYVVLQGFDTHANQAEAHQALLSELGGALRAFMQHLKVQGNHQRVAVVTFSEFGRRVRENASRGTDHGAAAPMFVVSGRVRPGLTGEHPPLDELHQGDLQYQIDYRRVYASLLENWLGADSQPVLGDRYEQLDLFDNS